MDRMNIADQADLRQWATLPESFQLGRKSLAPGKYKIKMIALDGSGIQRVRVQKKNSSNQCEKEDIRDMAVLSMRQFLFLMSVLLAAIAECSRGEPRERWHLESRRATTQNIMLLQDVANAPARLSASADLWRILSSQISRSRAAFIASQHVNLWHHEFWWDSTNTTLDLYPLIHIVRIAFKQ